MSRAEIVAAETEDEQARLAAELLARAVDEAVRDRGAARIALSGGSTPSRTYARLGELDLPWERIAWFWVDERSGPAEGPRSNFAAAARALGLGSGSRPTAGIFRMEAEREDLDAAARDYEARLREAFGVASGVYFDAITLGVGEDGHTASIFPGVGTSAVRDRLVCAVPPQPALGLEARLTLTAPVLEAARLSVVLARGKGKQGPVRRALEPGDVEAVPARLLQRARGRVVWVLDRDALP